MPAGLPIAALLFVITFVVGLFLVYRGIRGVPTLSDPKCAKCGYDLRWVKPEVNLVCPECGSDLKARRAVRFGDFQRRPRWIVVGLVVILTSVGTPVGFWTVRNISRGVAGGMPGATTPTKTLITNLATTAAQPWDWNELDRRLAAGQMSGKEVAAAIDQLINNLKSSGNNASQPLHWSERFIERADKAGLISTEQYGRLAVAYYGSTPVVTTRARVRQGQPLAFEARYGGHWNLPGMKIIWAVRRVTLNGGRPLAVQEPDRLEAKPASPESLSGTGDWPIRGRVPMEAPPGKHTLTFEIDMGLVVESVPFRTGTDKPGQTDRWPKTRCTWSKSVPVTVEIVGPDQATVELVSDAGLDPAQQNRLTANGVVYALSDRECTLDLTYQVKDLRVPLACKVAVRARGQEFPYDSLQMSAENRNGTWKCRRKVPLLPPAVTAVDLILTPNVEAAEKQPGYDRIWGKQIILKDVPLRREDLEEGSASSAPAGAVPEAR